MLISTHAGSDYADLIEARPAAGFVPKSDLSAAAILAVIRTRAEDLVHVGHAGLEQVSDPATSGQGLYRVLDLRVRRQHHDPRLREPRSDGARRVESLSRVGPGYPDVDEHQVRSVPRDAVESATASPAWATTSKSNPSSRLATPSRRRTSSSATITRTVPILVRESVGWLAWPRDH